MCKCRYRGCLLLLGLMWLCFSGSANSLMGAEASKKHQKKESKDNKSHKKKPEAKNGINSGFYFLDGQYVDAPYFVTRNKKAIMINHVVVRKISPYEKSNYDHPGPLPKNLTRTSTLEDLNSHHYRMMSYYTNKLGPVKAKAKMFAYYKSLPFVKEVKPVFSEPTNDHSLENATYLRFTPYIGEKINVVLGYEVPEIMTEKEYNARIDSSREWIEKNLKKGTCIFAMGGGGEITVYGDEVADRLPSIIKIIRSNLTLKEKKVLLSTDAIHLFPFSEIEGFDEIITNIKASKQLDERLEALVKANKEKDDNKDKDDD